MCIRDRQNYAISIIERSLIYAIVAVAMNLLTGFTGLFSLGQAGFMAIGAYTVAIFTIPVDVRPNVYYISGINEAIANVQLPFPVALIPVSYTHLDVYKRKLNQWVWGSSPQRCIAAARFCKCIGCGVSLLFLYEKSGCPSRHPFLISFGI